MNSVDLNRAYLECRKRKRGTINAIRFETDFVRNFLDLNRSLAENNYKPAPSVCFINLYPKPREIFAADYRDRIVHHLFVGEIEPFFDRLFINDSYASRKNKGTLAAIKRLKTFIGKVTENHTKKTWYLQLDVKNFFMTIDQSPSSLLPRDNAFSNSSKTQPNSFSI